MNPDRVNARVIGEKIQCNYFGGGDHGAYILKWEGPINGIAEVGCNWRLIELPWPTEDLGFDVMRQVTYVQRLDHGCYGWNRLMVEVDKFAAWYKTVQVRCIYTLAVWNLAYIPPGEMPNMSHVGKSPAPFIPKRVKPIKPPTPAKPVKARMGGILKIARLMGYKG